MTERLTQSLNLPRSPRSTRIMGIVGLSHTPASQALTQHIISPTDNPTKEFSVTAMILPRITCDLPLHLVSFSPRWTHLSDVTLADPDFGHPEKIDLLLGIDIFSQSLRHGRQHGPPGSPSAFMTEFGLVLAGEVDHSLPHLSHLAIMAHHTATTHRNDILQRFWEVEQRPGDQSSLSREENTVVEHFRQCHSRTPEGRFVVPLPKRSPAPTLGESRTQAVRRFFSLERSLHYKGQFSESSAVIDEYFQQGHAELMPPADLKKPVKTHSIY